jgi:hypothetical protein
MLPPTLLPFTVTLPLCTLASVSGAVNMVFFSQIPLNARYILSTEGCTKETVTLDGHEATLYTKPSAQTLVWCTDDCMFVLMYWGADTQDLDIWALADNIVPSESQPLSPPTV